MGFMKNTFPSLLLLAAIIAFPASLSAQEKSSWYIGFGLGTGGSEWTVDGESVSNEDWVEGSDSDQTMTLNFGVGAIMSPKLNVGFDISAIRHQAEGDDYYGNSIESSVQINNYMAMATYFPMEKGFLLRGGLGLCAYQIDIDGETDQYNGFSALAGIGYAFWLGTTFNLGLNFDYSYQQYDDDILEDSHFYNVYVTCYWY